MLFLESQNNNQPGFSISRKEGMGLYIATIGLIYFRGYEDRKSIIINTRDLEEDGVSFGTEEEHLLRAYRLYSINDQAINIKVMPVRPRRVNFFIDVPANTQVVREECLNL